MGYIQMGILRLNNLNISFHQLEMFYSHKNTL